MSSFTNIVEQPNSNIEGNEEVNNIVIDDPILVPAEIEPSLLAAGRITRNTCMQQPLATN